MPSLKDKEWRAFLIGNIFDVKTGGLVDHKNLRNGKIPRISAKDQNNGIAGFYAPISASSYREFQNFISVSFLGSVFYHPYTASLDMKIHALKPKGNDLNKHTARFVAMLISKTVVKFSYGNQLSSTDLPKQKIILPITSDGEPDWIFMEDYIRQCEQHQINAYVAHTQKILAETGDYVNVLPLKEKTWKPFLLSSIFILETGKGKGLNHLVQVSDGISYLGATNRNNGVLCYVKPEPKLVQQGNGIAFIRNGEGSIGYSVYKTEPFIASSDLTIGYSDKLNRYTGLFITTVADTVRGKYNFNYKRSEKRLSKEFLNLPINETGEPDWEYMEQYTKMTFRQKLMKYLEYKELSIAEPKMSKR